MAATSMGRPASGTTRLAYRLSIETAGFLTLLLGAWGGIVAFVAPAFSFSGDGSASWTWNLSHSLLFLVPGAAACVAAMMIMIEGLSSGRARSALLGFGGFLAAICGAWLVLGPLAWPVLEGHVFFVTGATPLRELAYWIGYSLGPGGLLLALGAFVLGRPRTNGLTDPM